MPLQQVVDHVAAIFAAERLGIKLEQLAELVFAGVADLDLVGNPPQERLVHQVARLQVRGENHQLVERHLQLLAGGQREEIVPHFQRHDPAIEQLRRLDPLAAEVVDQQAAAVALHLQRGLVDVVPRVVPQFEVVHRQLAADDDRGPRDLQPAAVVIAALGDSPLVVDDRLVVGRVVELDDLAVFVERVRNPDLLAEAERDPLGQRRFAVARRAVEEHARAGVDRRAQALEEARIDGNAADGLGQFFRSGALGGDRLGVDGDDVVAQRHRRRADVAAGLHVGHGPGAALRGQAVIIVVERRRAGVDDELVRPERAQAAAR